MAEKFVKMETENYKFFQHKTCEFFPCHETKDVENFNCLFCYCPLYALGENCGGNFKILENGVKDCSACLVPHKRSNYDYIGQKFGDIVDLIRKKIGAAPRCAQAFRVDACAHFFCQPDEPACIE